MSAAEELDRIEANLDRTMALEIDEDRWDERDLLRQWIDALDLTNDDAFALDAALRAALALHQPEMDDKGWLPEPAAFCSCNPAHVVRYPCPTVRAITETLEGSS